MNKKALLFTGEHCAGCKPMKEKVAKAMKEFSDIDYQEINVDDEENEGWLIMYQIRSVPSLILLHKDNVKDIIIGNVSEHKIMKAIGEL